MQNAAPLAPTTPAQVSVNWLLLNRGCEVVFTGSHAYGLVHAGSDIDIVVKVTTEELLTIRADLARMKVPTTSDQFNLYEGYRSPALEESFKIGRINFILVVSDWQYGVWRDGTKKCIALAALDPRGYIDRNVAVDVFRQLEDGDSC